MRLFLLAVILICFTAADSQARCLKNRRAARQAAQSRPPQMQMQMQTTVRTMQRPMAAGTSCANGSCQPAAMRMPARRR